MRALLPSSVLLLLCAALPLERGAAQRVMGPGPDAYTLPAGAMRITLSGDHGINRERWNDGTREQLGAGFSTTEFGPTHNAALVALTSYFADLGVNGVTPSLGSVRLDLRQRAFTTRFGFEIGFYDWLTLGVDVPYVRTRAEAALRLRGDSGIATAGVNPIYYGTAVAANNATVIGAYSGAATALTTRRNDCQANAGAHAECPDILAELTDVNALIALTNTFSTQLATTYGIGPALPGLPFLPMAGSEAELTLLDRVDSLRTAFTRYGVTQITPTTTLPLAAQHALTAAQLAAMVDAGFGGHGGFGARPMTKAARQELGDVDLSARFRVFDSFTARATGADTTGRIGLRQSFGVTYRIGSGHPDLPYNFIDLGTGTGLNAIALRSYTDVLITDRLAATVTLGWSQADEHVRTLRVPSVAGIQWLESFRERNVMITPASVLEIGLAPRWRVNEYLAIGAQWTYRAKGEDAHAVPQPGVATSPLLEPVTLSSAALDATSDLSEHRVAWTLNYSTLTAARGDRARLPIEIGFTHEQSVASGTGILPRTWTDRLQIRYYARFLDR
jgi:hypothetical protein